MSTALTVYLANAADTLLTTADQLYSVAGVPATTNNTSLLGTATGWGEVWAQGNTGAWAAAGAIGAPTGHGFLFDVTTLEGQQLLAGALTATQKMSTAGTGSVTITTDIHIRAYKRSSGGTYTLIADMALTGQSLPTAFTNYSPTFTTSSPTNFGTGDKLYIDIWCNVTANTGASTQTIRLGSLSTDTAGKTGSTTGQIATPGYQPIPVLSTSPASLSFSATAGGANPASQNSTLSETAGTGTAWTSSISYGSGSGWLGISPASGTLAASGNQVVAFTCTTGALSAGTYTATVTFTATNGGATATVGVTFVVSGAANPVLATSPTSLSFTSVIGEANPASKNSVLSETAGVATAWTSSISYGSGSGWLAISPSSGSLLALGNVTIAFTCSLGALTAGTYTATCTLTATTGGATATVSVTFTITQPPGYNVVVGGKSMPIYEGSYQLDDSISSASVLMVKVRDDTGAYHMTKGQPVSVSSAQNGLQFTGFVSAAVEDRESPNALIKTDIGARDNHYLPEKRTYDGPEFTNQYAVAVVVELLNVLAQEGITAQYASRRDTTGAQFNAGTLTNVVGSSNVGDGDLELSLAGTPVVINENTTANFATGTLSNVVAASNSLAPVSSKAIKLVATCSTPGANNAYTYVKIWGGSQAQLANDFLSYDIFVMPGSPSGQMGVDLIFTDGTTWRDTANTNPDQQYVFSHPANDVGPMGVGQWYHRLFFMGATNGKTVQSVQVVSEGDKVGVYTCYIKNIRFDNAAFYFFQTTLQQTPQQLYNNGYSSAVVSVVNTYDITSTTPFRTSAAYSIDAAKLLQSSYITWASVEPVGTKIVLKYSLDNVIFQTCTKNAPLPNLPAGTSIAGKSIYFSEQFTIDPTATTPASPEVAPVLSALQVTLAPTYNATKADVLYSIGANADWALGTFTNTSNNGGRDLNLSGFIRNWNDGNFNNQTLFGTPSPGQSPDRQTFHIGLGANGEARSRFDTGTFGTFADGTIEVDILVDNTGGRLGVTYRTTFWGNADLTMAYFVEVALGTLKFWRGTNSSTPGPATQIGPTVTLNTTSGNWHRLKVVFVGSSHKIYLDDVLLLTATDSTFLGAGNVGLRLSNGSGSGYTAYFDNFGVMPALTGTWVSANQSLAGAGTYGNSVASWLDVSSDPGNTDTVLVETQVDGVNWLTATNGAPIPGLTAGQNLSTVNLKVRVTLTTTTASTMPGIRNLIFLVLGSFNASGNRISPVLSLSTVGRMGGSLVGWNSILPSGCTLGVDARVDSGAWVDVTSTPGGAVPGLTPQPLATIDSFTSNTSANYTSTFGTGGSAATWTYDTANSRIAASGGVGALFINNQATGVSDVDMFIDMDQSDNGGAVWRYIDANNFYELAVRDGSSPVGGNPNTVQLFKMVGGTKSAIGTANVPISFIRGNYKRFRVTMIAGVITVYMDGVQVTTFTDGSPLGAGKCGLRNDVIAGASTARFWQIYIQPQGQDVTSHTIQTRLRLASTNPLATPQVTDSALMAYGTTIAQGALIPQTAIYQTFISDALGVLANASDYWWYIDKNKVLYFLPQNALQAPWIASSVMRLDANGQPTADFLDANITIEDSADLYRNREIVKNVLAPVTINETHVGDGVSTSWNMANQVAGPPVITITVNGVSTIATVGIQNVDTGKQFYYTVGSTTITEDASGPVYDFTFKINFNGPGQFLTFSQYDDTAGQAARKALEGGTTSGIVVWTVDGTGLTKAQGDALAQADVQQYSTQGRLLKATTRRYGLQPGQLLNVFLPEHGVFDGQFLIRQVSTRLTTEFGKQQEWMSIEAQSGSDVGDWTRLYKRPRQKPAV